MLVVLNIMMLMVLYRIVKKEERFRKIRLENKGFYDRCLRSAGGSLGRAEELLSDTEEQKGEIGAELVIRHSLTAVHDNVVKAQVDIRVGHGVKISAFKPFSEHFVKILGEMEFLRRPCFQIFRKAVNVFAGFFIIDHFLRNDVKKLPALFKIEPDTSFGYFFAAINGNNAL